jgi:hypothetical protein
MSCPFSNAVLQREVDLASEQDASLTSSGCEDLAALKRDEVRGRTKRSVRYDDPHKLAALLREAASAHHRYEETLGAPDPDWPTWYAKYLLGEEA